MNISKSRRPWLALLLLVTSLEFLANTALSQTQWPIKGSYPFSAWSGSALNVYYSVPPRVTSNSPILIVIPGARRNADEYRDQWHDLALANGLVTLVVQAPLDAFPSEYEYNLGGVIDAEGKVQPTEKWLFSAIEPLFDDFVGRFDSSRKTYDLYGHSAGGGFVHRFLLFKPSARVRQAIAANPAFVTLADEQTNYPFGLGDLALHDDSVEQWFDRKLVVLLGDRDLSPRTKPLSNGLQARLQGPHVYARGLKLFQTAVTRARTEHLQLHWNLEIVPNVGHSNTHMASHAVKYLCQE